MGMDGMGEWTCCMRQGGLQGRADTEATPPDMLLDYAFQSFVSYGISLCTVDDGIEGLMSLQTER
ncbi:hypothetical protein DNTS_031736, partial [Danionella cerebrum]